MAKSKVGYKYLSWKIENVQEKLELVKAVIVTYENDCPLQDVCDVFGISLQTAYNILYANGYFNKEEK